MFDRFTPEARETVVAAQEEARLMRHGHVGTEHLLVALAGEPEIAALGLDRERARAEVVKTVGLGDVDSEQRGEIPFTAAAKEALGDALGEAMRLGHDQIRPGHLLLAVLRQRDGVARRLLVGAGAVPSEFRETVIGRLSGTAPEPRRAGVHEDARALLDILERRGAVAAWLRERGVDEDAVRRML
jgi:ATP-dependent Clp protease ATP-binding subunit ClpA